MGGWFIMSGMRNRQREDHRRHGWSCLSWSLTVRIIYSGGRILLKHSGGGNPSNLRKVLGASAGLAPASIPPLPHQETGHARNQVLEGKNDGSSGASYSPSATVGSGGIRPSLREEVPC